MMSSRWQLLVLALASCKRITSGAIDGGLAPSASIYAVETPRAQPGGDVVLVITIRADGALMIGGLALKDETELADRAREAVRKYPDVRATIAGDTSVPFGRVIAVMDALKRAGVTKIAFAVAP